MFKRLKQAGYIIYKAGDNLVENDGIELAGYLTFLSMLALFPFLVLLVAAAGFIGQGETGAQLIETLIAHLPKQAIMAIKPRIDEIVSGPPHALLTISILGAIWTSSSAVEGMRTVLNRAYQVSNPPTYILRRMTSILQILLFTLIIIVVMAVFVLSPIVMHNLEVAFGRPLPEMDSFLNQYFFYIGSGLLFLIVASLYYFLPNIKQSLLSVVPGAIVVVLLWFGGASLFTIYISNVEQMNIIYGSLGGFIATLIFSFIMNVIFIYGAEFNHLLNQAIGARMIEREHAEKSREISLTNNKHRKDAAPQQE